MHLFQSGPKRNYYGKADVIAYRLHRDGSHAAGTNPVFGVNVKMLVYGEAFWPTYTHGDNTNLVATDSMKNFIQRETANFPGHDLESYCHSLTTKFLARYEQAEGLQVSATEIPYAELSPHSATFAPAGTPRATACLEVARTALGLEVREAKAGITGFRLLRLTGSAFEGFVRDEYTTLPDIRNRPLHMWLDLDWTYLSPQDALNEGVVGKQVRQIVHTVFEAFTSGSIQEIIYQTGRKILDTVPTIAEVNMEGNNRTWDTILEHGDALGVYTEARPPFGVLGLTLRR